MLSQNPAIINPYNDSKNVLDPTTAPQSISQPQLNTRLKISNHKSTLAHKPINIQPLW
ncbi:hypothetical protein PGT21_012864 [Puccinia graminis f. sp. tritici]|uniref:Uncharacterized protein n=1 Tax=Puccinia graminis f. sp. tritici TaxID=56615 RepID=A0A5B0N270_PUCGR|nr:hypothetical protein PGTUg99_027538 [Puccinia graminis f. sp. tritici]KAA1094198.1 hypothetical protein PGT21_012864 [Puccinia graminis f. sp. tritici]